MKLTIHFSKTPKFPGYLLCLALLLNCADVTIKMPAEPLYVGSYAKVPVSISAASGLTLDSLDFKISAGPSGGEISLSQDENFDPAKPDIMLLAGHKPGVYKLHVIRKANNDTLTEGDFEVSTKWTDKSRGPGLWFAGVLDKPRGVPGAAWGGGPPGDPQNLNTAEALGTRGIDILLFDTSTKRYTTDATELNAIKDEWMNEVINQTESSRNYYREVSYQNFDLSANIYGPVQLSGPWEDYFDAIPHPSSGEDVWRPNSNFYQECATAGDALINFASDRTLVCISQSVDDEKFAWAYARSTVITTAEGAVSIGGISMPFDWETVDGRPIHTTFSHEMGHNLGVPDLYTPKITMFNPPTESRNLGPWDIMGSSQKLPHFSIAHKMMLGWIDKSWIELFNFQVQMPPIDATVILHPAETGPPASNRKMAAEIRIADGWNYYFEYRKTQSSQIGDQELPTDSRVLGTDVISWPYTLPASRPAIMLFDNDPDMDGSVLGNGQNYREVDPTDPMHPTDFTVSVSGITASKAEVRVQYGVVSKPDPFIRPWPASEERQWQSPDIEVKNAKNAADSDWKNVPWIDHENTIVATVYNGGPLNADDVEVKFFVKKFNLGGVPVTSALGSSKKDIPALGQATFQATWEPASGGHYCIRVEISPYKTSTHVEEISGTNNLAQSNYNRFISATASPPSREVTSVLIGNPFNKPTTVYIVPSQTNPYYRTYLQHKWLKLNVNETRKVEIMFEFAPDAAQKGGKDPDPGLQRLPNNITFVSYINDPRFVEEDAPKLFSGVQIQVVTGRATKIEEFGLRGDTAHGRVVTVDNGQGVGSGKVLLILQDKNGKETFQEIPVSAGNFAGQLPDSWQSVSAYYIGGTNYSDSESQSVTK